MESRFPSKCRKKVRRRRTQRSHLPERGTVGRSTVLSRTGWRLGGSTAQVTRVHGSDAGYEPVANPNMNADAMIIMATRATASTDDMMRHSLFARR